MMVAARLTPVRLFWGRVIVALTLPLVSSALTVAEAQHFLLRTGFGASPSDIARLGPLTYEQAVDDLLNHVQSNPITPPPAWVNDPPYPDQKLKTMTPEERMAYNKKMQEQRLELKAWWYREMIDTPSPFTERLTLFWHNHFTSGLEKVHPPELMYRQNLTWRRFALGNFRDFLTAASRDPAMILYLDTQSNHKGHPNENFARELMELFTLGVGQYREKDVQEGARAFTGWQIDKSGQFVFRPGQHDEGQKVFLGQQGAFYGDDILTILLDQPRLAEFITEKLWREFISPTPEPAEVTRLAAIFRNSHYELRPLLRAMLLSPAFRDPKNAGTLTRSPVELMVGTIRTFQVPMDDTKPLAIAGRDMGEDIFDPPNVKGWSGGTAWITTNTWLLRRQFLDRLLRGKEMEYMPRDQQMMMGISTATMNPSANPGAWPSLDLNQWMGQAGNHDEKDAVRLASLLLPVPPQPGVIVSGSDGAHLIRALVFDPAYELK